MRIVDTDRCSLSAHHHEERRAKLAATGTERSLLCDTCALGRYPPLSGCNRWSRSIGGWGYGLSAQAIVNSTHAPLTWSTRRHAYRRRAQHEVAPYVRARRCALSSSRTPDESMNPTPDRSTTAVRAPVRRQDLRAPARSAAPPRGRPRPRRRAPDDRRARCARTPGPIRSAELSVGHRVTSPIWTNDHRDVVAGIARPVGGDRLENAVGDAVDVAAAPCAPSPSGAPRRRAPGRGGAPR